MKIAAPKGTRDVLPPESGRWQEIERIYGEVCKLFGFGEIRIPTFESTEIFQRGVGDTTDVVSKEMYTFDDKGGRSITLRPEGTAGVARSFIENGLSSKPFPVRFYYNISAFRYENVQKGRYREFHQLGLEAFGADGPGIDADIICLLDMFFKRLGINDSMLQINSIGCPVCRTKYNEILREYLKPKLDRMCKTCNERYKTNPLRIIDCKEPECRLMTADVPLLISNLCENCVSHFDGLKTRLDNLGISYEINSHIVRGLDYYTRTVFEFVSTNVGTQGTICGGGRYDGLINQFGGGNVPGIGFAMGVERLVMELDSRGLNTVNIDDVSLYIASMNANCRLFADKILLDLRNKGLIVDADQCGRSFKSEFKYAVKALFTFIIVLGDDEIRTREVKIKRLSDGTETLASLENIYEIIKSMS